MHLKKKNENPLCTKYGNKMLSLWLFFLHQAIVSFISFLLLEGNNR